MDVVAKKLAELKATRKKMLELPESALDIILNHKQPEVLVRSFNPEDLHVVIKEIGTSDALPVITMATDEQWNYMLDIEGWQRDQIDLTTLGFWLQLLYSADNARFVNFAIGDNLELTEVYLQDRLEVFMRENEEDDISQLPPDFFTFDDIFYVRITVDNEEAQFIRDFLSKLADADYATYQSILLESRALLTSETLEDLYRIKTGRLEEKGIPRFEEAISIYKSVQNAMLMQKRPQTVDAANNAALLPTVMAKLPTGFEQDFAGLVNAVMVADGIKIGPRQGLATAVQKAMGYLRIAFNTLEQGTEAAPAELVQRYPVRELFSYGFSQVLQLKWYAQKKIMPLTDSEREGLLAKLNDDEKAVLAGVLLKRPMFYANYAQGALYREFESIKDIEDTRKMLDKISEI